MDTVIFQRIGSVLLKAFVRSQWIAAPVGLTLAAMECISPDHVGIGFPTAATTAWYIATPVAMILCLVFGS